MPVVPGDGGEGDGDQGGPSTGGGMGGGIGGIGAGRSGFTGGGVMDKDILTPIKKVTVESAMRTADLNRNNPAHQAALYAEVHDEVFGMPEGQAEFDAFGTTEMIETQGSMMPEGEPASSTPTGDKRVGDLGPHKGGANPYAGKGSF